MSKTIKLKSLLKEGYAWERKAGKPLPTIQEVMDEFQATQKDPVKEVILKENYRDPKENLDVLINLLNTGKVNAAIKLIKSIQSHLEDTDLVSAFDEAVEIFYDKGNRGQFYDSKLQATQN